jgi:hypothetical protein
MKKETSEQKEISMDRKYAYRNGEPARILCVDGNDVVFPVIAMDRYGIVTKHNREGKLADHNPHIVGEIKRDEDLIEVKEVQVLWINVYKNGQTSTHRSDYAADLSPRAQGGDRVARIKVGYVEGQFDE